jgi:CRISPR-associated protein Cmr1
MVGANRGMSGHQRLSQIPADAFPRAEFGLPIVFHFQGRGEPPDTTLQPVVDGAGQERMASPLILKPLALADGQAVPIIVPLVTPGVSEVELMQGSQSRGRRGTNAIRHPRLARYPNSPLNGLSNQGSALEAFVNFARIPETEDGPGFEEITQ